MAKKHNPRFLESVNAAREIIAECSSNELNSLIKENKKMVIIDVRERHEFEAGHLEGAIHIGKGVLERDIEDHEISDDEHIILYCGGGFRSALAAKSLQEMGWKNVSSLWGGWKEIKSEGLPIVFP